MDTQKPQSPFTSKGKRQTSMILSLFELWLPILSKKKIALFGAGQHSNWLIPLLKQHNLLPEITVILDDFTTKDYLLGIPISKTSNYNLSKLDLIIISSDSSEQYFKRNLAKIYDVQIECLYFRLDNSLPELAQVSNSNLKDKSRILFVIHDATRSGAPLAALNLLNHLHQSKVLILDILFLRDGDLYEEFNTLANCYNYDKESKKIIFENTTNGHYQLIFGNSVASCKVLLELAECTSSPIILWVHELEILLQHSCGKELFKKASLYISKFIAVSDRVRENLYKNHYIPQEQIYKIPPLSTKKPPIKTANELRKALNIPSNAFVVGGCGSLTWLKGIDLYIQVAMETIKKSNKAVHFLWIGDSTSDFDKNIIKQDINKLRLNKNLHLLKPTDSLQDYFNLFDLFLLTSREESFSLVCLESAREGIPVLCFEEATAVTEYIDSSCGHISPYLDTKDMSNAVLNFINNPTELKNAGENIKNNVKKIFNSNSILKMEQLILNSITP